MGGGKSDNQNHRKTQKASRKSDFWVLEGGGVESAAWELLPLSERTRDAERNCCWAKEELQSVHTGSAKVLREGRGRGQ